MDASEHGSHSSDIPVLIVGGGPVGLLMAHMLSRLGVKCMIIERYEKRLAAPKAHALSPRTLEICRQFDLDIKHFRQLGTRREDAYWVNFVTTLGGTYIASIPYERMDAEVLAETPLMIMNIPQPIFENLLAERIQKDGIEIRKPHSFVNCRQDGESVITTVEDRSTGSFYEICSRHVVACDGARSKVRECLGVSTEGESSYETMMTIHFEADLRSVVGTHLGMLHWFFNPSVSGFIIGYDLGGNQVLICNFDSKKHPIESWDEALCQKVVADAIGKPIPHKILSYRPWVLSRKVAESYCVGNVFLAGDAAHSFPPTGGLGLNSGLGDVHNLAYKLAAVHKNWANASLLETYESDRRHVAILNAQQSLKNGLKIFGLLKALGMTDQETISNNGTLCKLQMTAGRRNELLKEVEGQVEHFDNLGLHIGYVYGDNTIPVSASLYKPCYRIGGRIPHVWLKAAPNWKKTTELPPIDSSYVEELTLGEVQSKRYSTLDLCSYDAFTFITDSSSASQWSEKLQSLKGFLSETARTLKINHLAMSIDFDLVPGGRAAEWVKGLQLLEGAAVLIRPDQHILGNFEAATTVNVVFDCLAQHLGLF
ncbi:FAD binding domain-containing protein [Bisporella sp. PMI_857]|nr:FAD binding domain-containing protein [Bisporella sp. PMI_857]